MFISEKIGESPTLVFAEAAKKRRSEGKNIISMGIGEPDIDTPSFLTNAVSNSVKDISKNGYLNAFGVPLLREEISKDIHLRKGYNFFSDQIIITAGAKQAIQLALFSILEPGDEAIFFTPCYVSYIPQILLAEPNAKPVDVPLSLNFEIDLIQLESKITAKTKVILLNTPHNPTGKVFDKITLSGVIELAIKNDIYIIFDDVYELLTYESQQLLEINKYDKLINLLFVVNSFSKSHAIPGWRLGYLCAPKNIIPTLLKIQQHMHTNTSSLIQYAGLSIFENGFSFLDSYREELIRRAEFIYEELKDVIGSSIIKPQGGFFYFLNISAFSKTSNEFCADLIEKYGVALTPGAAFGNGWDSYVRLSFGVKDLELKEGIERIVQYMQSLK